MAKASLRITKGILALHEAASGQPTRIRRFKPHNLHFFMTRDEDEWRRIYLNVPVTADQIVEAFLQRIGEPPDSVLARDSAIQQGVLSDLKEGKFFIELDSRVLPDWCLLIAPAGARIRGARGLHGREGH